MSSTETVKTFFDKSVAEWDVVRYRDETYLSRARVALHWLCSMGSGQRVLDVGCGTGHQTLAMLKHGHLVVAMDFSEQMARATRDRVRRECPDRLPNVIVADAQHLPFREESFDGILALGLVGFVKDRVGLLRGFHARLKPRASLVCDAGVPEEDVLFQRVSRALSRLRAFLFRRELQPAPKGWYSNNFIKHKPAIFERMLEGANFQPVARGGGGFGDLQVDGVRLIPWRAQAFAARCLSWLSMRPGGGPIARRALTYVVCSEKR